VVLTGVIHWVVSRYEFGMMVERLELNLVLTPTLHCVRREHLEALSGKLDLAAD
jgi:hypothetical protein